MKKRSLIFIFTLLAQSLMAQSSWKNPIVKQGRLGSPLVETSPFVFHGKLYLLENNQRFWDVKGAKPGDFFHDDEVRIKDVKSGKKVSVALKNHGFGTAFVWKDSLYVFAGNYGAGKPWRQMTEITMTATADLKYRRVPAIVCAHQFGHHAGEDQVCHPLFEIGHAMRLQSVVQREPRLSSHVTLPHTVHVECGL